MTVYKSRLMYVLKIDTVFHFVECVIFLVHNFRVVCVGEQVAQSIRSRPYEHALIVFFLVVCVCFCVRRASLYTTTQREFLCLWERKVVRGGGDNRDCQSVRVTIPSL